MITREETMHTTKNFF